VKQVEQSAIKVCQVGLSAVGESVMIGSIDCIKW